MAEDFAIIKASGAAVLFDVGRIRSSVLRAGATPAQAEEVVHEVGKAAHAGMATRDVAVLVKDALTRRNIGAAWRYGLRAALLRLGPAGFQFEKYVAALWAAQGYATELPEEFEGGCVRHEVDVVARKGGRAFALEVKFRNRAGDIVNLKDVMAAYARYVDLLDGAALRRCPHFDEFWIVTNGGFSERGERFGRCKGLRLIGWNYPEGRGLARIIDHLGFYPLTIVPDLTKREFEAFTQADSVLCKDLLGSEAVELAHRTGLPQSRVEELIDIAAQLAASPAYATQPISV